MSPNEGRQIKEKQPSSPSSTTEHILVLERVEEKDLVSKSMFLWGKALLNCFPYFFQGKYECLAVNKVGEDVAELQLTGEKRTSRQYTYARKTPFGCC